jgi:hypothetical protein
MPKPAQRFGALWISGGGIMGFAAVRENPLTNRRNDDEWFEEAVAWCATGKRMPNGENNVYRVVPLEMYRPVHPDTPRTDRITSYALDPVTGAMDYGVNERHPLLYTYEGLTVKGQVVCDEHYVQRHPLVRDPNCKGDCEHPADWWRTGKYVRCGEGWGVHSGMVWPFCLVYDPTWHPGEQVPVRCNPFYTEADWRLLL